MIIVIILLIGVIIYYYSNNSLYEKFISEDISIDDIINNPSKTQNFINSDNRNSINTFKKNIDLEYLKKHSGLDIIKDIGEKLNNLSPAHKKKIKDLMINQLAPIASRMGGKVKIPVTNNETNRIPDMLSTSMDHILPKRNLDMVQKNTFNKKSKNKQPQNNEYFNKNIKIHNSSNKDYCTFIASENSTKQCPDEYPVFTGAKFSGLSSTISCGNNKYIIKKATAVATISKGKLIKVLVVSSGKGYKTSPKIKIISKCNGSKAKCKAHIRNGSISNIEITSPGSDYASTPSVIIEKPNIQIHCKLCCKKEL